MEKTKIYYMNLFALLKINIEHANLMEDELSKFGCEVEAQICPIVEESLVKLRVFRDSLWAIDKALEIQKNKDLKLEKKD